MINTETITINGRSFTRTYSDAFHIQRDGVIYTEAVDLPEMGDTYTETDIPLPDPDPDHAALLDEILTVIEEEA